jgi:transposase
MAAYKWRVALKPAERTYLHGLISAGEANARRLRRAHTLLMADDKQGPVAIGKALHVGRVTVARTCQRYCEAGLEAALSERPRPGGRRKLTTKGEATLVALACSDAPEGRVCWTMQLLADRLVALEVVAEISDETVRRTLKKTS